MLRTEPSGAKLTREEKESLRESLVMHMDKNPMRQTVAESALAEPRGKTFSIVIGVIIVLACLLALAGFIFAR